MMPGGAADARQCGASERVVVAGRSVACGRWKSCRRSDDVVFDMAGDRAVLLDAARDRADHAEPGRQPRLAASSTAGATRPRWPTDLHPRFTGVGVDELRDDIAAFLAELVELGLAVDAAG